MILNHDRMALTDSVPRQGPQDIASLEDPTRPSDAEAGFCADTERQMARGSLVDFWSISSPDPTVSIWSNMIHVALNSRYRLRSDHWCSGAYLTPEHL